MTEQQTKKHKLRTALLGFLGAVLAAVLADHLTDWKIISRSFDLLKWFLSLFIRIVSVPVWILLVLSLLSLLYVIVFILKRFVYDRNPVLVYNRDIVFDILWQWRWYAGAINPITFLKICPLCSYGMDEILQPVWFEAKQTPSGKVPKHLGKGTIVKYGYSKSFEKEPDALRQDVERELLRRIREGEFTNAEQRIKAAKVVCKALPSRPLRYFKCAEVTFPIFEYYFPLLHKQENPLCACLHFFAPDPLPTYYKRMKVL